MHGVDLKDINTSDSRNAEPGKHRKRFCFMILFNNIRIAKLDASVDEIEEACRKAGIHEFIMSLPKDYATPVARVWDSLSGGERQGLAWPEHFYMIVTVSFLDEPTSNLDALNEAVIH